MKDLLYELKIEDDTDEVYCISLVESPAIESDWVYFDKEVISFAKVDTEQRMLIGPILIADKKILRVDGEGQPYHVFFSKETVKKLAQNYLMKKYTDKASLEHEKTIKGVHLVESWIKDGKLDKSNNYGLNLPEGTWVGMFKVTDEKIWNDYVKTGKVKGFSVEALLEHKLVKASIIDLDKDIEELSENEVEVLLSQIKAIIRKDKRFAKGQRIEMESFQDYGSGVRGNAKRGRELNEKNGNKCATQVGKVRSAQLEAGEAISLETIKRMFSYLSRAEAYYDESDMNACGTISYLLWGGKAGLQYSRNKLRELGVLLATQKVSFDYDETLSTERGMTLAKKLIDEGYDLYIISAGRNIEKFYKRADELGIPHSKLFALGSNKAKIEKIKELGIVKHYDNNADVVNELGNIGVKFEGVNPSIPNSSYPGEKAKDIVSPSLLK